MRNQVILSVLILVLVPAMVAIAGDGTWAVKGNYTESCSCNPACPCVFGSAPTHGYCEGNGLFEIKEGHYGDVQLDGVSAVMAFSLGEWARIYVDENASDDQVEAVKEVLLAFFPIGEDMQILSVEKVPVTVERSEKTVKFSVPASAVEIELMEGRGGKPIRIKNLPASFMIDYTQYKSVTNTHKSDDKEFSYSGTNGLTSRVDVSGGE